MAGWLILETTFLVDVECEVTRGRPGPESSFLDRHDTDRLAVTPTVVAEVAAGFKDEQEERWRRSIQAVRILEIDDEVSWQYSRIYRFLRENGFLIGTNDLWIAATARAHGMPVVTRNEKHFQRVPGLEVVPYVP